MRRRRGSTLIELLFTMALSVVVLGSATLVFLQAVDGAYETTATADMALQASLAGGRIEAMISQALSADATTFGGKPALKLTMPANESGRDNLGIVRGYAPDFEHPRADYVYLPGKRVWIIGAMPGADLKGMWTLADRADDSSPTPGDVDWNFAFDGDSAAARPRYPLPMDMTFSVNAATRTVTFTMSLNAGTTSQGSASLAGRLRDFSVTRSVRYRRDGP